jgi:hypothetical protein
MDLCKYKYMLGKPGVGFHQHVMGVAILDVLATAALSYMISSDTSFLLVFVVLMIISVCVHYAFCVPTTLTKMLGLA